jgi:hypothetical protein
MDSSLKRGSVVLAIHPFTDLSSAKRRPALVVSATGRSGRDCILAFITSRTGPLEATDLVLDPADGDFAATGSRMSFAAGCSRVCDVES